MARESVMQNRYRKGPKEDLRESQTINYRKSQASIVYASKHKDRCIPGKGTEKSKVLDPFNKVPSLKDIMMWVLFRLGGEFFSD